MVDAANPTCAESTPCLNRINRLVKRSVLLFWYSRSGDKRERQVDVLGAHALGQDDAEAVEQRGLGGVGLCDTAQPISP